MRLRQSIKCTIFAAMLQHAAPAAAVPVQFLGIDGDDGSPGITGTYPLDSQFSWMFHIFPGNTNGFSWTLGPGTDGGIILSQAQDAGAMMGIRPMFNEPTTFFSVNGGLTMDATDTIDMANLRMRFGSTTIDVGSGSGHGTLVPLVSDTALLAPGENGWMQNPDGTYHLIYNTRSTCADCDLKMHLYGSLAVPVPAAAFLFLSGLSALGGVMRVRRTRSSVE